MNPDYSRFFQAISQHNRSILQRQQSMNGVRDRLADKRKAVADACQDKLQHVGNWRRQLFDAHRREACLQGQIADLEDELRLCQAEIVQYCQEVADCDYRCLQLEAEVDELEEEYLSVMEVDAAMRGWGEHVSIRDFSDELLALVLTYVDYVDQQRMIRVCRRWRYVIATGIDHIYLDWPTIIIRPPPAQFARSGRQFPGFFSEITYAYNFASVRARASKQWPASNRQLSGVRRMTLHAGFDRDCSRLPSDLFCLLKRCPKLVVFSLHQLPLEGLAKSLMECGLIEHWKRSSWIQVRLVDCTVLAFGLDLTYRYRGFDAQIKSWQFGPVLRGQAGCVVPVADVSFMDHDQLMACLADVRLTWPYPMEQTAWLKQYAPCLNGYDAAMETMETAITKPLLCPIRRQLCVHLDQSFYENMTGPGRNIIAAILLKLQLADVPPPPAAFGFKRVAFSEEGKLMVDPVDALYFNEVI